MADDIRGAVIGYGAAFNMGRHHVHAMNRTDGIHTVAILDIDEARTAEAKHFPAPRDWLRYCLHLQTTGRWVGHGGYGGQYLLADPESGVSVAFFSVLEDESGYDQQYIGDSILMCQEIAELPFGYGRR